MSSMLIDPTEEVAASPDSVTVGDNIIVVEPTQDVEETPVNPTTSAGLSVNIPQPFSP